MFIFEKRVFFDNFLMSLLLFGFFFYSETKASIIIGLIFIIVSQLLMINSLLKRKKIYYVHHLVGKPRRAFWQESLAIYVLPHLLTWLLTAAFIWGRDLTDFINYLFIIYILILIKVIVLYWLWRKIL